MFDVFYIGKKPGLFTHEKSAESIQHACEQSNTRYCWIVNYLSDYSGWDWLWEPVPWQAHQRHAWASQHQKDSETYLVPKLGYNETNYHAMPVIPRVKSSWTDVQEFDYTWHPDPTDPPLIYQFGTQWQKTGGPRYVALGATEIKYVDQPRACTTTISQYWDRLDAVGFDYTWQPDDTDPPLIYQFGTQWQKTGGPRYCVPGATEIKYVTAPRANKITTDPEWSIPTGTDLDSFDWTWHPDATEQPYIYQFGTQHQRTGGPQYCVASATEIKYVDQIRITTTSVATCVYLIDHLNAETDHIKQLIAAKIPVAKTARYFDNYHDTLRRLVNTIPEDIDYAWVCSSVCDYSTFDFSWHPEVWQNSMLHVFPSDDQKFGDTFFINVSDFRQRISRFELLEWYDLNFVQDRPVPRLPMPIIKHNDDTHVSAVNKYNFVGPYALYTVTDTPKKIPAINLWRPKYKTIVPLSTGGSSVIVPRPALSVIQSQLYDYPYIDKTHKSNVDDPIDIVFVSNGEPNADQHFLHLTSVTCNLKNRLHRVDGVNGRVASQRAAAQLAKTNWYFVVPAKLEVDKQFDWNWQPDRLQQPKHYIFHAHNPVNGLQYGHMAVVAYNKKLVLETTGQGLDFTMEKAHEVVPVLSGIAYYNSSAMMCWRTAFREVIKLKQTLPDIESQYRLNMWLSNTGEMTNSEWSQWGAEDAVEYYDQVSGEFSALQKSYEWEWLASYALIKRNLTLDN
jgi:hypothetical protein